MTRTTSTRGQASAEELQHVLEVLRLVCKLLVALDGILERGIKNAPKASDA